MNIFVFDKNLRESAWYFFSHDPVRANKQLVELVQCIAVAHFKLNNQYLLKANGEPYSVKNHENHPVIQWMIGHDLYPQDRLQWCVMYAHWLHIEYTSRRQRIHSSGRAIAPLVYRHGAPPWEHVVPIHHGNGVPRSGMVYADYIYYLHMKNEARV